MLRTAVAGGAWLLVQSLCGLPAWASYALGVLVLAAALAPPRSLGHGAWLLLWSAVGAGTQAGVHGALDPEALLPGGAAGLGFAVALAAASVPPAFGKDAAVGLSRRALWFVVTAGLAYGARLVPAALSTQDFAIGLPGQLSALLSGAGLGLVVGASALVRRLGVRTQAVDPEQLLLPARPGPGDSPEDEVAALVRQAVQAYRDAIAALPADPRPADAAPGTTGTESARAAAEELVNKIARFGRRWAEIDSQARASDRAGLEGRHRELTERRDKTEDEQARAEFGRAIAALDQQLQYLREIDRERERAVARLHHQVATLERLRLAALRHRSVDAARQSDELKSVVEDLSRTGQELDSAAEALAELPMV